MDVALPSLPCATDVKDAVSRLGGRVAVAELCDVGVTAVGNWCSWNLIPDRLYRRITKAARDAQFAVPDSLFGERKAARTGEAA